MSIEIPETKTIFEPFQIKTVEPLPILTLGQRREALKKAHYNLFGIPARDVTFDMLTDSGTSAMSARQWGAMMEGDESYAGSESFFRFEKAVSDLTGMKHVIPTHQGRAAEVLLSKTMMEAGQSILGNTMFDTTRANIESSGCHSVDLPCTESEDSQVEFPFKGNVNLEKLEEELEKNSKNIPLFIMTVTNNSIGGQPVSMANIKDTKKILDKYNIPMFIDAARFAENAYFIKKREPGYENKSIKEIAQKLFSYSDGVLMSAKKDTFANIGGFLAVNDDALAEKVKQVMVIVEGFPTYGGLSGRDLEAVAVGLEEILEESYLSYRITSVDYFGRGLEEAGFKVVKPFGGHAVYIDVKASLPHIPVHCYPAQSLSVALYEYMGLRTVEVGSVMFGRKNESTGEEEFAPQELVRLAMPRRVYTQSHVDYLVEMAKGLAPQFGGLPGYKITYQPQYLRHFTAHFEPVEI